MASYRSKTDKVSGDKKRKINLNLSRQAQEEDAAITSMMMDPRYLRQSSSLIQDALQRGFDVLQLPNGNIVLTGTKTIVHTYSWDDDKGKLGKLKPKRDEKSDHDDLESEEDLELA